MDNDEVNSAVKEKLRTAAAMLIDQSRSDNNSGNSEYREKALEYYEGEVDFPPMGEDHSKYVSRDVSDTIGLILPGLMRVFFGSSRIVDYEPCIQEHEAYNDEASDYVNYVLMQKLDGYEIILFAFFDALLLGNGIIKYWWDDTPEIETMEFEGLTSDQIAQINVRGDLEIQEGTLEEYPDPQHQEPSPEEVREKVLARPEIAAMAAEAGYNLDEIDDETLMDQARPYLPQPQSLYRVTVKKTISKGRLNVTSVPPEEFLMPDREIKIDESTRFAAHWRQVTRSTLVEEGFSKELVYSLPAAQWRSEETDREGEYDNFGLINESADASTELVDVYECYILIDTDDDGIAERWRVDIGGTSGNRAVLRAEEFDDPLPFADVKTDPVPHRWRGRSVFDETSDIQDIKTVLTRGMLDNLYDTLKPQTWAEEGSVTNPDEMFEPSFGGVVWHKPGAAKPEPLKATDFLGPQIAPALDMFDKIVTKRTGISPESTALNIEALQNQSATAVNAAVTAAYTKIEQYARNLKECAGLKRFFANILTILTKHQDWPEAIKRRGEWVSMTPSQWDASMRVHINTGLGTGSRERDFALLQGIAGKQESFIAQAGPLNEDCNISHLFETYRKMAEAGGVTNPEVFFPDLDEETVTQRRAAAAQQQKQNVNPEMMEAQRKAAAERYKIDEQIKLDKYKADREFALKEREMQLDHDRRLEEMRQEAKLAAINNAINPASPDTNINRV